MLFLPEANQKTIGLMPGKFGSNKSMPILQMPCSWIYKKANMRVLVMCKPCLPSQSVELRPQICSDGPRDKYATPGVMVCLSNQLRLPHYLCVCP